MSLCEIEWASNKKLRARKVISRSNAKVTLKYPSWKENRMIHCESSHEEEAFTLLDADSSILHFREQPARFVFNIDEEIRIHFPDIYVETAEARIFKEVKEDKEVDDYYIQKRTEYLSAVLPTQGYFYELLTESEINIEPRLSNSKYLLKYGRTPVELIDKHNIVQMVMDAGYIHWGEIVSGFFGHYGISKVSRLILEGVLAIDMNAEWIGDTRVTLTMGRNK